jgi:eukaryotic-like serine/threonine-protein kinase
VAPPEPSPGIPTRVGRYEVLTHLATGGMAQIYLARQTGLGAFERHVVLKTILRERATDQRFVTMFLDEAKLAATLNHQNIAQVYEVDQADGAYFMAMEYVHGENARAILETTLRRGWTIPLELAIMIVSGAAAGLHHAHERRGKNGQPLNIVHRDVSPANIMVGYDGSVKVLDFGIAKAEERATKTVGGTIKGKYGYMSPEQCKGKPIDRRSDIFALGICLYELTTLRRAFKGNDDFETMKRIVAGDVMLPSVAVPGYPRELEAIVLTAMANDAAARFQTGQEMIEALDAFAVRAKLTGTNTAMGRFMVQLFGSRREPWVDGGAGQERTQITGGGEDDADNEKTHLIEDRQPPNRLPTASHPGMGATAPAQAAEWQHDSRDSRQAPPTPLGYSAPPQGLALGGTGPQPSIPYNSTGPQPSIQASSQPPIPQERFESPQTLRPDSNPGQYPLVDDQLWPQSSTPLGGGDRRLPDGGATRLATQYGEPTISIKSKGGWILLVVLMIAGLAAGVLIAWQSTT